MIDPAAPLEPLDHGGQGRSVPPWINRAIATAAGWVVVLFAAAWALGRLRSLVLMVLVAFFLSLAMEPAVDRLARRGWRRGIATGVVLVGVLVLTVAFLVAVGTVVVGQARDLVEHGPRYVRDLERFVNRDLGIHWNADSLVRRLRTGSSSNPDGDALVSSALDVGATVATALLQLVTVLVFAFYMTADGPRMRRVICSRLPRARQKLVLDAWEIAIDKTGGYLYSRGIQALVSAVATTAFLYAIGVPYAYALGLWVGVISQFIPTIGTYIAMALPVLVAFRDGPAEALWVLIFLVAYQQFENYVLGPRVTRHTMQVHPALTIGTVFAGGLLFGAIGAVLALPATAVIQALLSIHTVEQPVIETRLTYDPGADEDPPD